MSASRKHEHPDTEDLHPSPSKKPNTNFLLSTPPLTPPITCCVHPRGGHPNTYADQLPPARQGLYQGLLYQLTRIQTRIVGRKGKARENLRSQQQDIIAAISGLYLLDDEHWEVWQGAMKKQPIGVERRFIHDYGIPIRNILDSWLERPAKPEERSATNNRSSATLAAQRLVPNWYNNLCILTGRNTVEACHIVPDCIIQNPDRSERFWEDLARFWPNEDLGNLMEYVKSPENQPKNLLVMSRDAHADWGKARFALRPLQQEGNVAELQLEFMWMRSPTASSGAIVYERGPDTSPLLDHRGIPRIVESGDIIRLVSTDIQQYPLPCWGLLNLQWSLNRVARALAAADVLEKVFRGDDEPEPTDVKDIAADLYDPFAFGDPENTPFFSRYIITAAVQLGLVHANDIPYWENELIPREEDEEDEESDEPTVV